MQDIFWGAVLIAIGLLFGGSVFLGNFDFFSIFFDALGVFFIVRGIVKVARARQSAAAQPPPPSSPPPANRPR